MPTNPFQSKLQDIVYNVDSGIGLQVIKVLIYLMFVASLMLVYTAARFKGLNDPEAMDYAQLARNMQTSGHFTTKYIRPASVRRLLDQLPRRERIMDEHPDIVHPPLYPALLAAGYSIVRPSFEVEKTPQIYRPEKWVIVPLGHICTML
ncbi:MAG TPA: hypothetical protein VIH35_01060, partial [Kiritimatiellia bacterium]